jgi:hypothetical protein
MAKIWSNDSRHDTFEAADARRNALLDEKTDGLLVKVKHTYSDDRFTVKTYLDPAKTAPKKDDEPKETRTTSRAKTRAQRRSDRERLRRGRLKNN